MNRALLVIVVLVGWAQAASAQSPDQIFQEGNRAFQQGKFQDAIAAYERILAGGYQSGELLYNLGNAYYRTGDIAHAILNYERAARLMPNDDDLQHNLQLANLLIPDRIEATPRLFIWQWWDSVKSSFSLVSVTWIAYLAYILVMAGIIIVVLARTYAIRRVGMLVAMLCGVFLVVFVTLLAAKVSDVGRHDEAIVVSTLATVKNSPDTKSSDAFVLHNGVKVVITDAVSEWIKVRLADGKVGWVEKAAVEVI